MLYLFSSLIIFFEKISHFLFFFCSPGYFFSCISTSPRNQFYICINFIYKYYNFYETDVLHIIFSAYFLLRKVGVMAYQLL